MASVTATQSKTNKSRVRKVSWALASGDTGKPVNLSEYPDKTLQVSAASYGSVTLRGSNKDAPDDTVATDWFNLTDQLNNALTFTADGGKYVAQNPLWVSPIATGGSGYTVAIIAGQ